MILGTCGSSGERLQRHAAAPCEVSTFLLDPAPESGGIAEEEAVQERPCVARDGGFGISALERVLELRDVGGNQFRIGAQVVCAAQQRVVAEFLTNAVDQLRQRVARVIRVAVGPEESQQLVAADRPMAMRCKDREQREAALLCSAPRRSRRAGGSLLERQSAERPQPQHVDSR